MTLSFKKQALYLINFVSFSVLLTWPLIIWHGLANWRAEWVLILLATAFLLRFLVLKKQLGVLAATGKKIAFFGIALCLFSGILREYHLLLYYPVVINALLFTLFYSSLSEPVSLVERLARLQEPELSAAGVKYTRRVTQVWCVFFIVNGAIAFLTCIYGDMTIWAAYNGMISYVLMGTLMGTEWLVRQRIKKRE
eukprot:RCo028830